MCIRDSIWSHIQSKCLELAQHNVEVLLHELIHRSERPKPYAGAGAAGARTRREAMGART